MLDVVCSISLIYAEVVGKNFISIFCSILNLATSPFGICDVIGSGKLCLTDETEFIDRLLSLIGLN